MTRKFLGVTHDVMLISFLFGAKRDALANIGGLFCFRDEGLFHKKFSTPGRDIGIVLKEKQILNYGNDRYEFSISMFSLSSYGGVSGREIMAMAQGMYQVLQCCNFCNTTR